MLDPARHFYMTSGCDEPPRAMESTSLHPSEFIQVPLLSTSTQTRTRQNVLRNAAPSLDKVVNLQCSVVFTQKL